MNRSGDNGISIPDHADENMSGKVFKNIRLYTRVVDRMWFEERLLKLYY
ncbi:MAG: hypothetical protein ACYCWE_19240 [Eubacteriales bacterium]